MKEKKKGKGKVPFNQDSIRKKLGVLGTEPKPTNKQMQDKGFKKDSSGNWGKKKK